MNPSCAFQLDKQQLNQQGFTLIEVMVVIAILSVLGGLIVPKIMSRPDEARAVAAKQDIASIMQALSLYHLDTGSYPSTVQGLSALVAQPTEGIMPKQFKSSGYLSKIPTDPWGYPYQYLYPGLHAEVDVFSLGADHQPGGDGPNADFGSWQL